MGERRLLFSKRWGKIGVVEGRGLVQKEGWSIRERGMHGEEKCRMYPNIKKGGQLEIRGQYTIL